MARHFLGLYLLIAATLAVVSWGQDRLLQAYSGPDTAEEKSTAAMVQYWRIGCGKGRRRVGKAAWPALQPEPGWTWRYSQP